MTQDAQALHRLLKAIAAHDDAGAQALLREAPDLARAAVGRADEHFLPQVQLQLYAGDTALHVAAAAYGSGIARQLIALGADLRARNRRGAGPLHSATVGSPGSTHWNPQAQARMIAFLVSAGADANAPDKGGVTPLHRAVRNRCTAAVEALLDAGADAARPNGHGSTPLQLAMQTTGRGGTGTPEARAEQARIIRLLQQHLA